MVHSQRMNDVVGEILTGSYDLQVYAGPDPSEERRLDVLEVARHAYEAEMGGFVLKSHDYVTSPLAYVLNRMYPGLTVGGAIALNCSVGGLNPHAVQVAANLGARIVWMPTYSADYHLRSQGSTGGIKLTNDQGSLRSEIFDILDIINQHDMVLASGYTSAAESILLFKEAKARGVQRMIASSQDEVVSVDDRREMMSLGAYSEYTFRSCIPFLGNTNPEELVADMRSLGVGNCVVTTGFGQWMNPPPAEGMRMSIAALLQGGMNPEEVATLVKANPSALLGYVHTSGSDQPLLNK